MLALKARSDRFGKVADTSPYGVGWSLVVDYTMTLPHAEAARLPYCGMGETEMGYRDATYVVFDGDNDQWAYRFMRGWKENDRIDFDFRDAHDLTSMTSRAQDEAYVKSQLRQRMKNSKQVIVLVGESTKNLRKFVPWEIDLALELDLPIIVVNLNGDRSLDKDCCPAALRNHCAVHIDFKLKIIRHALDHWPAEYGRLSKDDKSKGYRFYSADVYRQLSL